MFFAFFRARERSALYMRRTCPYSEMTMTHSKDIERILKGTDYFGGLDPHSLRALSGICLIKKLKKSDVLFHEGQTGFGFFLLVEGGLRVTRASAEGKEMTVKVLRPGEVFGEVVLFEKREYPARALAVVDSEIIIIPRRQIFCLLEDGTFRSAFLSLLMNKLRYLTDRLLYLTAHDVEERFFIFVREQYGEDGAYHINLTKKDFASAVGTNPETLSRLITRLQREGRVLWKGKTLKIIRTPEKKHQLP